MNVYETKEMGALLASNRYPGRGIVLGLTPDGKAVLYTSDETGYEQLYLVRLPDDIAALPPLDTLVNI